MGTCFYLDLRKERLEDGVIQRRWMVVLLLGGGRDTLTSRRKCPDPQVQVWCGEASAGNGNELALCVSRST